MSQETRDPRAALSTAKGTVTWTGLIAGAMPLVFPQLAPAYVGLILGGIILSSGLAGSIARDRIHDLETSDPPQEPGFLLQQIGKRLG
jgi:hypothetical protein